MVAISSISIRPFLIAAEIFHLAVHPSEVTKPCIFETAILFPYLLL